MLINPNTAIENGWIKFPEWMSEEQRNKCIQPNALDFDLHKMFTFTADSHFILSEQQKTMRPQSEVLSDKLFGSELEYFNIPENSVVDCMSSFHVTVPEGAAALLIVRSTLNRNGMFITSGLYDAGFSNYLGYCLHNRGPAAKIARGTRVGQIMFITSESSGMVYSGQYNNNKGKHWAATT